MSYRINPAVALAAACLAAVCSAPALAASPGKPGAPVTIAFDSALVPRLGQPMPIRLTVHPTADVDRLEVQVGGTEGLSLVRGRQPIATGARSAGDSVTETLTVTPVTQGLHQLRVTVFTRRGTQKRASVSVFPVAVGAVQLKPPGKLKTTPQGERIIEMQAQEPRR